MSHLTSSRIWWQSSLWMACRWAVHKLIFVYFILFCYFLVRPHDDYFYLLYLLFYCFSVYYQIWPIFFRIFICISLPTFFLPSSFLSFISSSSSIPFLIRTYLFLSVTVFIIRLCSEFNTFKLLFLFLSMLRHVVLCCVILC